MPHRTTHRRLLPAILAVAVALLPACRKAEDIAAEAALERATGTDVDVARNGETVRFKAGDAQLEVAAADQGGSVPLPADFPQDVHLPAPIRVESAMDMAGLKMVNVTTPSAMAQVSAEVEQGMQAQGWKREMAMQAGDGSTLVYSKDQRQTVYQLIRRDQGGTQLAIRTGAGG
jgi:hypothetical protein